MLTGFQSTVRSDPRISLECDNGLITSRQLQALQAVASTGSINAAAEMLSVRPPVIFRHIRSAEASADASLITSSKTGSGISVEGRKLLDRVRSLEARLRDPEGMTVACSPVTEELLMSAIPRVDPKIELVISHDRHNIELLRQGRAMMAVIDDPLLLMDIELPTEELGQMDMVHVDRGDRYVRHRYGAQRIAFRHLEITGQDFTVEGELLSVKDLMDSGRSFFIDDILLLRKGVRIQSSTDPGLLRHSVMAVHDSDDPRVTSLIRELRERMRR